LPAQENPFFAAPAPAPPAPAPAANPFLAAEPAPQPAPHSAPIAEQLQAVLPIQPQPGAIAPSINDPHAAFRKGSWKKPILFGLLGAGALFALFFLVPESSQEKAPTMEATREDSATVIGRSVGPDVIEDPNNPTLAAAAKPEEKPVAPAADEPVPSPNRPDRSGSFADVFKSAAK
jgi:hypothetical protein